MAALQILHGNATGVAATITDQATQAELPATRRKNLNRCVDYLTNNADHLNYDHALDAGWPIATGIIEGACCHLIKDRMDITGARWGLPGAEAILKLRALHSNSDTPQRTASGGCTITTGTVTAGAWPWGLQMSEDTLCDRCGLCAVADRWCCWLTR